MILHGSMKLRLSGLGPARGAGQFWRYCDRPDQLADNDKVVQAHHVTIPLKFKVCGSIAFSTNRYSNGIGLGVSSSLSSKHACR